METTTNPPDISKNPSEKPFGQLNAWKALLVFLAYIILLDVGQAIFGFAIGFFEGITKTHLGNSIQVLRILSIAFGISLATVTAITLSWFFEKDLFRGEQETKIGWSWGPWVYLKIGLAGGTLLAGGVMLISTLLPIEPNVNPSHFGLLSTEGISRIIRMILMIICAPIAEELLFRGIMFYGISRSWGQTTGIILVTLLFAILHITKIAAYWPAFFALIFLGASTIYLRIRSKSLGPSIALHSSYNLIIAISVLLSEN